VNIASLWILGSLHHFTNVFENGNFPKTLIAFSNVIIDNTARSQIILKNIFGVNSRLRCPTGNSRTQQLDRVSRIHGLHNKQKYLLS
jgi:hypothetical protein